MVIVFSSFFAGTSNVVAKRVERERKEKKRKNVSSTMPANHLDRGHPVLKGKEHKISCY